MRCWQCGVEPEDVIEITRFGDQERRYLPGHWPPGDHAHAVNPPTPAELLAGRRRGYGPDTGGVEEMTRPPAPLEWHPYYRGKTWLLDWLERRGPYADHYDIRIPVIPSVRGWTYGPETEVVEPDLQQLIMTRRKASGPAPYVGRPFAYMWPVGTDNLGRHIAGEARIVYLHSDAEAIMLGYE